MKNFNTNIENEEEWLTPPEIIVALGPFHLDPCAQPPDRRIFDTADRHLSKEEHGNGLEYEWRGRVWLNPPYGRETFKWLEKLAKHGSGIALIFARTETKGFHTEIWQKAHSVFFFEGRLKFYRKDGSPGATANAPSCLISYSASDTEVILAANKLKKINGKLVLLQKCPVEKISDAEMQDKDTEIANRKDKLIEQMREALKALRKYPNTYIATGQGGGIAENDPAMCDAALAAERGE